MRSAFVVRSASHRALRALNYTPEVDAFRAKSRLRHVRLGSVLQSMGPAYGAVFKRLDCERAHGVELITQGDMFAAEPEGRIIRMDSMARPERHRVKRWQILIAGAGTLGEHELYGRSTIADERVIDRFVGPHAMVLTFADEGGALNLYAYAFLCTAIGIKAVRSASFGTKILGLRKDILSELPIPLPDDHTIDRVAANVRSAISHRERYATSLKMARGVVEALPEMVEAQAMCLDRRARCIEWRGALPTLNAWNFVSTGGADAHLLARWPGRLSDVVPTDGVFRGNRFARVPCDDPYGVDLYSQRDVFLLRAFPQRVIVPNGDVGALSVPVGSLLAGGQGTLGEGEIFGRVALATPSLARSAISEHILRIQPNEKHRALAYAFLSTLVGLRCVRAAAVGTKLLSLRPDLLRKLPIPTLGARQLANVDHAVKAALEAHEMARLAEAEAIRAIEKEVLPKWLA